MPRIQALGGRYCLRVGLERGEYRITGSDNVKGTLFLQLHGAFRCPAAACQEIRWQNGDATSPAMDTFERI